MFSRLMQMLNNVLSILHSKTLRHSKNAARAEEMWLGHDGHGLPQEVSTPSAERWCRKWEHFFYWEKDTFSSNASISWLPKCKLSVGKCLYTIAGEYCP